MFSIIRCMLTCQCGSEKSSMKTSVFINCCTYRRLVLLVFFLLIQGCSSSDSRQPPPSAVARVIPVVIRSIPHQREAFTQGLVYHKNKIYESTGIVGKSSLRRINPADGAVEINIPVPGLFGEGLVFKDNALIQLTWTEGNALIYTLPDLKIRGSLRYQGEGWGITTDGVAYIMSNGSDTLYYRDNRFAIQKKVAVTYQGKPLNRLNELEYAKNRVYANVWFNDCIYEIDPSAGKVLRLIDCTALINQIGDLGEQDVLNGIAYNNETNTFYITGKYWPRIFEVRVPGH